MARQMEHGMETGAYGDRQGLGLTGLGGHDVTANKMETKP